MNINFKKLMSVLLCFVLLLGVVPVNAFANELSEVIGIAQEEAAPVADEGAVYAWGYYDHIDVRKEGPSITMQTVTKNLVTEQVLSKETQTIKCTVVKVESVTYTPTDGEPIVWDNSFADDRVNAEFRQQGLRLSKDLSGASAVIVVDLLGEDNIRYEDVTFTFGPDGCELAQQACPGWDWSENGLDFILDKNDGVYTEYVKWIVPVEKVWVDNDNQDGIRPESVEIELLADGEVIETLVLDKSKNLANNENVWYGEYHEHDALADDNHEIKYTVRESKVPAGYTVTYGQDEHALRVINTHTSEKTSVTVSKEWNDADNQDGIRPGSVTVNLMAGEEKKDSVVLSADNNWTYTFSDLDKYADSSLIEYTVTEENVEGYTAAVTGDAENGYTVTNTHEVETADIVVTKIWDDKGDQDGKRPDSITVQLYANGEAVGEPVEMTGDNDEWTYTFEELAVYAEGEKITYTVAEVDVPDEYTSVADGLTITNSYTPETTQITITKKWEDNDDQDGIRPESIQVQLKADGEAYGEVVTMTDTTLTINNLPVYANGAEIEYTVEEINVPEGYEATYDQETLTITNTHEIEKTEVTVTKVWEDNNDQDGKRPASVTINLLADGVETGKTLTLNEGNEWKGSFTDLDVNKKGEAIVYKVEEASVPDGYTAVVTGDVETGFTVTNTHTPETTEVTVTKVWDDAKNQDGKRPDFVTVKLLAGNKDTGKTIELTGEGDTWTGKFENLDKYANGDEIVYTVKEVADDALEGYNASYSEDGLTITNTYAPEETNVSVEKVWDDADDQDGIRPEKITINLLANGEKVNSIELNEENKWSATFEKLDKFADGEEIVYTVSEEAVEGYEEPVITGDATEGYTVTNKYTPETIVISGTKTWDDANNQDGKRPEKITVRLHANGKEVATATVTAETEWKYTFTDLPKNEAGEPIVYTVTEDAVEGYTVSYDGYNITNSYTPGKTSITVTKSWVDGNDNDGIRPNSVTVVLYADGVKLDEMTLNAKGKWTGVFEDLPVYKDGVAIKYTVTEVAVKGYNTTITGDATKGFTVTNTHNVIPQTGDNTNLPLYIGMFGAGLAVMAVLLFLLIPKKKGKYVR